MSDEEQHQQEGGEQPLRGEKQDVRESSSHDDHQRDATSTLSDPAAELTDLIKAEVRPPTAHIEVVITIVASRSDAHERRVEYLTWLRPVDETGRKLTQTDHRLNRFAEHARERVADSTAEFLTDPIWEELKNYCRASDYGGSVAFADKLADWNHDLLRECLANTGLPAPFDAAIVVVVPLPGDQALSVASDAIRIIGVAFAFATGHLPWACASLQSLAQNKLIGKVSKLIEKAAAESLHSAAQAVSTTIATTKGFAIDDEPISISKRAAGIATPPGGWISAAQRLAAAGVLPDSTGLIGATRDHDASGPAVGLAARRPEATGSHEASGSAYDV